MKNFKRLVALGMAVTMLSGSMSVFAADTTTEEKDKADVYEVSGNGAQEGPITTAIYKIKVPTKDLVQKKLAYYVDPQGLVAATAGQHFGTDLPVEAESNLYFVNYGEDGTTAVGLSSYSDPIEIINKSSMPLEVMVSYNMIKQTADAEKEYSGGYSTTADFSGTNDADTGLYLGLITNVRETKAIPKKTPSENFVTTVESGGFAYETTWNGTEKKYEYKLGSVYTDAATAAEAEGEFPRLTFQLYGLRNESSSDSLWFTINDDTYEPENIKVADAIDIQYWPRMIVSKTAIAWVEGTDIMMQKATSEGTDKGGFASAANITVKVNGVDVGGSVDQNGFVKVGLSGVNSALGVNDNTAEFIKINAIYYVENGVRYYAEF